MKEGKKKKEACFQSVHAEKKKREGKKREMSFKTGKKYRKEKGGDGRSAVSKRKRREKDP